MKIALTLFIVLIIGSRAFGSCGAENCPLYHFHYNLQGALHLTLSTEYINQDQLFLGSKKSFVGAVQEDHDEVSTINSITIFQMQYGISNRFDIGIAVPYLHREHSHIHHQDGQSMPESWNFNGLGDISLTGNYALIQPQMDKEMYLGISAGLKFPTGMTDAANSGGEQAEVTIQPGTGSFDAIMGLNFRYPLFRIPTVVKDQYSTIPIIAGLSYKIPGMGTDDYQFGKSLLATIGTEYQVSEAAGVTLQINFRDQGYADTGITGEPEGNTGSTKLYVSPGLNLNFTNYLNLYGIIQLPVYQKVNGLQQTSTFNLQIGISANAGI